MCGCVRNGPVTGLSGSYLSHSMWKGCARGLVTHTRVASTQRSPGFFSDVTKPMWSNRIRSIRDTDQSPVTVGVGNPYAPSVQPYPLSAQVGEAERAAGVRPRLLRAPWAHELRRAGQGKSGITDSTSHGERHSDSGRP